MKKYKTPKGWEVIPRQGMLIPELYVSPEGIIYKRQSGHEIVHVIVETKYGSVNLREWEGSPTEKRASKLQIDVKNLIRRKASTDGRRKKTS